MAGADPYRYFRLEARELLDQFGEALLELQKAEQAEAPVKRLLRLAHTLKGAARVVRQSEIADHAHAMEEALTPFRESMQPMPRDQVAAVSHHVDEIGARVGALTPAEPAAAQNEVTEEVRRTVRTDLAEMDALLAGVSEAYAQLNALRPAARAIEQGRRLAGLLVEQLGARDAADAGRSQPGGRARATAEELRKRLGGLERDLSGAIEQLDRELHQLHGLAERLRLVPAGTLFTALERTALGAAQALGKAVVFEGRGGGVRLDAYVLGVVQDALVQAVRNAVAHGIEFESERRAMGKPMVGRVTVEVARRGRRIVFLCRDDGRGLDLEAIRRAAQRRGVAGADADQLDAGVLMRLLLQGGISTADTVTDVSGRGVGLDVVRDAVEKLGGEVAFRTEAGAGTTFELVVPATVAAIEALMVEAGGAVSGIPFDVVRRSMRVTGEEISRTASGASIIYAARAIPFYPLQQALNGVQAPLERSWPTVVIASDGGLAAIGVDRLLRLEKVVVRPLPDLTPSNALVAGAALDSRGDPRLILDPDGMADVARRGDAVFEPARARRPVLVVDDSLTTRMLEQSILESAGYEVDIAISAEHGLEAARRTSYALFLVDVDMPGMDGFSFVEHIRRDPALRDTPAILVTSRDAPEDRQRGVDAGAQGYVIKSQFDQAELLRMIRRLVD